MDIHVLVDIVVKHWKVDRVDTEEWSRAGSVLGLAKEWSSSWNGQGPDQFLDWSTTDPIIAMVKAGLDQFLNWSSTGSLLGMAKDWIGP